ncbi:MAG: peptidoglycan DD-metalloendopeptidase family protein [Aminipila sp.]
MRQKLKDKKPMDRVAVALVLCFSVVALASVFTVKSSLDKINLSDNNNMTIPQVNESEDRSVTKRVPTVDSKDNPNSNGQNENGGAAASEWVSPVQGSVTVKYSTEMPIYSPTLNQYMVHNGVDIASTLDSRVQAVASGTVVETFKDDRLGETIKINHGNGFITTYSNLSPTLSVEVGDVVKQGDILGGIGDTALFESSQESHLHFEMEKDGTLVNPSDYIQF